MYQHILLSVWHKSDNIMSFVVCRATEVERKKEWKRNDMICILVSFSISRSVSFSDIIIVFTLHEFALINFSWFLISEMGKWEIYISDVFTRILSALDDFCTFFLSSLCCIVVYEEEKIGEITTRMWWINPIWFDRLILILEFMRKSQQIFWLHLLEWKWLEGFKRFSQNKLVSPI